MMEDDETKGRATKAGGGREREGEGANLDFSGNFSCFTCFFVYCIMMYW
jgi:hypothetical protein